MAAINSSNETGGIIGFGGVSLAGVMDEDSSYSFNLASGITSANIGNAVSVDTTAPYQVKLAVAGDILLGRLETVEVRTIEGILVGTVATEGGLVFPYDAANAPTVGASVQGGTTAGTVKLLAAAQGRNNVVLMVDATNVVCTVLFL